MDDFSVGSVAVVEVTGIQKYGIFVKLDNGYTGLIHISEISDKFVSDITKFVDVGEKIYAEIKEIKKDEKKYILSIKNINYRFTKPSKVKETLHGFTPLKEHLPIWIEEKKKEYEKEGL